MHVAELTHTSTQRTCQLVIEDIGQATTLSMLKCPVRGGVLESGVYNILFREVPGIWERTPVYEATYDSVTLPISVHVLVPSYM